jgi:hypothetical protein
VDNGGNPAPVLRPIRWGQAILFVVGLLVGYFLAVAIHEAAHAVVGVLAGFSLRSLRIGPLRIDRSFRISLYRGRGMVEGGWAAMSPDKTDALVWSILATTVAGPAANLLSAFTVFLLVRSMGPLSVSFMIVSLFLGVISLLPLDSGAEHTDGLRVMKLLRSRKCRERLVALARLHIEFKEGVPIEKLSADSIAKAIAITDNSPETVQSFAIAFATVCWGNDDAKTADYIETCLKYLAYAPPQSQHGFMSNAGIFQARRRKRIDLAEQWLAAIRQKTEPPWLRTYTEVAICEAEGDIEGALKQLGTVEELVLALPDKMYRERWHRSIMRWKSELQSRTTSRETETTS